MKPFLQISLCILAFSLVGCGGNKAPLAIQHPYLEETKAIEMQATDALLLGNYQLAQRLYKRAYSAYSAIGETDAMARQLINQAQVALLVEDFAVATNAIDDLTKHIAIYQHDDYRDRLTLLRANLAIGQQDWRSALEFTQTIDASPNSAIRESAMVSRSIAAWKLNELEETDLGRDLVWTSQLSRARYERLLAEISIDGAKLDEAAQYLEQAKSLYRQAAFAPGVAETLMIEAKLAELENDLQRSVYLKQRAAEIFKRLGNRAAISRYNL